MSSVALSNSTTQRAESHHTAWTRLWRTDAVANLLFSDILLFAAVPVQKTLDMSPDAVTPIRIIGAVLAVYSLLQLWFTRQGEPPHWVYRLAALDMVGCGAGFALVLLAGVEMNTAGVVGTAMLSAGSWLLVGLYYARSRQLAG
jgi:hypothetical protein